MRATFGRWVRGSHAAVAFWLAAGIAILVTVVAAGYPLLDKDTWTRGDTALYLQIAEHGYHLSYCSPSDSLPRCGDAAWFPLYPWIVGVAGHLGLPLLATAIALSWACSLAALVLLTRTFLRGRRGTAVAAALLYAAFAPGLVYDRSAFPLALFALATLACLWLVAHRRWAAGGLAGAAAAAAYPPGLVLALPAAVWPLVTGRGPLRPRLRDAAVAGGLVAAGTALVVLVQRVQTGRWDAYLLSEGHYGHTFQEPFAPVRAAVAQLRSDGLLAGLTVATAYQTALVTIAAVLALAVAVRERRRLDAGEALVGVWLLPAWVAVNLQTNVTTYRVEATLMPVTVLLARLPRAVVLALAVSAAAVSVPITLLFVRDILT